MSHRSYHDTSSSEDSIDRLPPRSNRATIDAIDLDEEDDAAEAAALASPPLISSQHKRSISRTSSNGTGSTPPFLHARSESRQSNKSTKSRLPTSSEESSSTETSSSEEDSDSEVERKKLYDGPIDIDVEKGLVQSKSSSRTPWLMRSLANAPPAKKSSNKSTKDSSTSKSTSKKTTKKAPSTVLSVGSGASRRTSSTTGGGDNSMGTSLPKTGSRGPSSSSGGPPSSVGAAPPVEPYDAPTPRKQSSRTPSVTSGASRASKAPKVRLFSLFLFS